MRNIKRTLYLVKRFILFQFWNAYLSLKGKGGTAGFQPLRNNSNLVFIVTGLIGDTVMSMPTIAAIKEIFPGSKITVVGRRQNIEIIKGLPGVDHFHETDFRPFSFSSRGSGKQLLKWLKANSFDAGFILLGDDFAKILFDAGIPVRVGVKDHILRKYHTDLYEIKSPKDWGPDERLNAIRCLGYDVKCQLPKLFIDNADENFGLLKGGYGIPEKFIVLHSFGSTPRQWWSLEKSLELASNYFERHNIRTILVGGPVTREMKISADYLIDLRGKLSLSDLKLLIKKAALVVSTDSGPLHLAAALNQRVVGLFRSVRPEIARIYPNVLPVYGRDRDCELHCEWDKCRSNNCAEMGNISVDVVLRSINQLLEA